VEASNLVIPNAFDVAQNKLPGVCFIINKGQTLNRKP
jgi:hypothetical protein